MTHAGRFWLNTIVLTATIAVLFALAIAALTGTAALALRQNEGASDSDLDKVQTRTGVITDAHCGARHLSQSGLTARDCARVCIKQGSPWALVDGDEVYLLKGDSLYFEKVAGTRVRVSGTVEGHTINVQSHDTP